MTELEPHEELSRLEQNTTDDGRVFVTIHSWEKHGDTVRVKFETPAGDIKSEQMDWPDIINSTNKFVRLIEESPHTMQTAESLGDGDTTIPANPDTWELYLPEETSLRERLKTDGFHLGELLVFGLLFPIMMIASYDMAREYEKAGPRDSTMLDDDESYHESVGVVIGGSAAIIFIGLLAIVAVLFFL